MLNRQMEMSFGNGRASQFFARQNRRQGRAHWWFARMRQVVDHAMDWQPAARPRPEQIWFPNAHRQVGGTAQPNSDERQICE